ncbi:MAG: glycosyltransferase [bacterium]
MIPKVCHISTAHPALDTRIFFREAVSLAKAGYPVFLVGNHPYRESVDSVEIVPLPRSRDRVRRMAFAPWSALGIAMRTGSRIFHLHDPELLPIGLLLRTLGKQVIWDSHEDYPGLIRTKDWLPRSLRPLVASQIGALERMAAHAFSCNIAPTDPLARRLPRGISLYNYPTMIMRRMLASFSLPYEKRDIDMIHIGRLRKSRIDFILSMLESLHSMGRAIRFAMVGLDHTQLEAVRRAAGDWSDLLLYERKQFPIVAEMLGRSKIALNYHPLEPHLAYAVPVKIFEYLNAGCVVLCSHFPFLESLLGTDSPVEWADPEPEVFAQRAITLLKDPERMKTASIRSEDFAGSFTWEHEEPKLLEAYAKLK